MDFIEAANAALEKRAKAFEQRKAILDDTALTDVDKRSRIEAIDAEMTALEAEARRNVEAAEREAEARALNERAAKLAASGRDRGNRGERSVRDEAAELRELAAGKRSEVVFDLAEQRTAQSGVAGNAGNTKPVTFSTVVQEAMRERSRFMALARVVNTAGGEVMEWPVKNGLNPATPPVQGGAGIVPENTAYGKADQTWSKTSLGAHKYGVIVEATEEIVQDSALPILSILAGDAGETIADLVTRDLLIGDGTNKPHGWVTRATAAGSLATLSAVTFDDMMDLMYALTAPYRANGAFVVGDMAVRALRGIKDNDGRYMWQPAVTAGAPDVIFGKPVITDPNLPVAGVGAKAIVFGDPAKYLVRQVRSLRVVRSDEYGYDRDVIAFKVTWRGDGDVFDLNSVKALTLDA